MPAENSRTALILITLCILTVFLFILDITLGSVNIPITETLKALVGFETERSTWKNIILNFRLPKALTAVIAGAALSISGLQMQTLFRNPVAEPFILGISSGASLGVALLVLTTGMVSWTGLSVIGGFGNWSLIIAAVSGAALTLMLVMAVASRVKDVTTILILGLMFGTTTAALISILQYFSGAEMLKAYIIWSFGSLGGVTWMQMKVLLPVIIIGVAISIFLVKPLNALLLGENYAVSMGLNISRTRNLVIMSAAILAGSLTAFCGPIAFVGIAVPHIARIVLDTSNHKLLIPGVLIIGPAIMLLCDIISQMPGATASLPINSVTSLFGAPLVIWLVLRRKSEKGFFNG